MIYRLFIVTALAIGAGIHAADSSAGSGVSADSQAEHGRGGSVSASAECQRELRKIDFDKVLREVADARTSGDATKMRAALDSAERQLTALKAMSVSGSSTTPGAKETSQSAGGPGTQGSPASHDTSHMGGSRMGSGSAGGQRSSGQTSGAGGGSSGTGTSTGTGSGSTGGSR